MQISVLFWVLMVLVLIFGGWRGFADPPGRHFWGMSLLLWVILFVLGWRVFGFIIQDEGPRDQRRVESRVSGQQTTVVNWQTVKLGSQGKVLLGRKLMPSFDPAGPTL
jgi:hypothetical protein